MTEPIGSPHGGFGLAHLPYAVGSIDGDAPRVITRIGGQVCPVGDVVDDPMFQGRSLNEFLAMGPDYWHRTRERLTLHLSDPAVVDGLPTLDRVVLRLPIEIGDYVDFYSSLHHATNLGRILRPDTEPLLDNWRHLPVGYHGRAATVAVSGTPVRRPVGLVRDREGEILRRPTDQLDIEAEVGFIVGVGNTDGSAIAVDDADAHVFGVALVNDWSARDLQAFEYQPLGPMLGKSFLTSMAAWITPLEALRHAMVEQPLQEPAPDAVLQSRRPWGLDLHLGVDVNGTCLSHPESRDLYWTFAQQLAHLTSNGAVVRTGDLYASGTVSGAGPGERGSLIELTWRGRDPVRLDDGSERTWLDDGDLVTLSGRAQGCGPTGLEQIELGEVTGAVLPTGG